MRYNTNSIFINCLKKGEKEAFLHLIRTYHHALSIYANSLVNNKMLAEDIVQNVFVEIWEKRKKLNPEHSIKQFLYKCVYNEFIDHYRKSQSVIKMEKRYITYLNNQLIENEREGLEVLIKSVKLAIEQLPPKCKQIFKLSKQEGLTNMEISEYLNISVKAVEAQITRGFRLIRDIT